MDLSESGAQIQSHEVHQVGTVMTLTLKIDEKILDIPSEIIWCKKTINTITNTSTYNMGLMFVGPSIFDQIRIRDYFRQSLATPIVNEDK